MEFIGIEHNIMLSDTHTFLIKESIKPNYSAKTTANKIESLEKFLIQRISNEKKYTDASVKEGIEHINALFSKSFSNSKNSNKVEFNHDLSSKEPKYLSNLNELLDNVDFNVENNIEQKIIEIEREIESETTLSNKQLITLFSATQTAKFSYRYWHENWSSWADLNKTSRKTLKHSTLALSGDEQCTDGHCGCNCEDAKDIIKADAAGAIGGAVTAAVVNVVPGAGQVAYGGAIVAGAVGGSAVEAANKLLDWLW